MKHNHNCQGKKSPTTDKQNPPYTNQLLPKTPNKKTKKKNLKKNKKGKRKKKRQTHTTKNQWLKRPQKHGLADTTV